MPRIDRLWYEIDAETKGFEDGVLRAGDKLSAFAAYAKGHPLAVLGALGAAAAVAGVKISQMGARFESEMVKVQTVARASRKELDGLGAGVQKLFSSLPV